MEFGDLIRSSGSGLDGDVRSRLFRTFQIER